MAETKAAKAAAEKATKPYVGLRNAETAVGSVRHGEVVYLHDGPEVQGLVDGGYLQDQETYLKEQDPVVLTEMERQGVSARESGSGPAQ